MGADAIFHGILLHFLARLMASHKIAYWDEAEALDRDASIHSDNVLRSTNTKFIAMGASFLACTNRRRYDIPEFHISNYSVT